MKHFRQGRRRSAAPVAALLALLGAAGVVPWRVSAGAAGPTDEPVWFGAGVTTDAGLTGSIVVAERSFDRNLVDDLIVEGNRLVPARKIISLVKTRPGAEYQQSVVNADVRRLSETGRFANVRAYTRRTAADKVKVYLVVAELPTAVQEVLYRGTKHLTPDELEAITGLRKGTPLNPTAVQAARQAIVRRYEEMGRLFASVEVAEGDRPGDTRVVFNITEGPVAKIKSIRFEGNTFVSSARLCTQIDPPGEFLRWGGRYDPLIVDHDVSRLEEYYRGFGYKKVHVSRELRTDDNPRAVHLIFHIHEGPRTRTGRDAGSERSYRDILVTVHEKPTGALLFGVGVGSATGPAGGGSSKRPQGKK